MEVAAKSSEITKVASSVTGGQEALIKILLEKDPTTIQKILLLHVHGYLDDVSCKSKGKFCPRKCLYQEDDGMVRRASYGLEIQTGN
jgi:hypothetical protein